MCSYCSPECQAADWSIHKRSCKFWSRGWKHRATTLSGNPKAWEEIVDFAQFHHNSFMNSALAAYIFLQPEEAFADVASDNVVVTTLEYRNDPTIPPERKFEPLGTQVLEKNDPRIVMAREDWSRGYDETAMMGRQSLGDSYRGTGTYLLFVRFRPQDPSVGPWGLEPVVWTQHFNIDEARARAKLACRDAIHQLEENIREGKKMRICCSTHSQRWPCCCKGRTHDDDEWDHEDEDDEWDEDEDDGWDEEDEWDDEDLLTQALNRVQLGL
ncbi:hypothetical protein OH76DRAFT_1400564 [Lentinus brumalis]|uniref:MYND-type domain-containing protein n=1 Tax=Lentinus brumalis TaxID=2498619 RepID=A0A371DI82_9APHY|nr:hypothetical protein OH76DRAFT_1400564 [Polyporus brumalis]